MRMFSAMLLVVAAACTLAAQAPVAPPKTFLKVGDMAPDFTLPSTLGGTIKLSDYRGKKTVVVSFYPAAFTGGCTKEMQAYALGIDKFEGTGAQILGVSGDNTPSQKKFAESLNVTFPMLSDFKDRKVMAAYGVLVPDQGIANRATFVVDKNGRISSIVEGSAAIDVSAAATECDRLAHKAVSAVN